MLKYRVNPVTCDDYRRLAEKRLPRFLFDYIDGAAGQEISMSRNVSDLNQVRLEQRVMRDVSDIETSTRILGSTVSMPLVLGPVALAGMYRRRGEAMAARAAVSAGLPFTTSTMGICSPEEVQEATGGNSWFQLYMLRDRTVVETLLARAAAAGCDTLVFTVDLAVAGMRLRDYRNGMLGGGIRGQISKAIALATSPRWVYDVGLRGKPHTFGNISEWVARSRELESYKAFVDAQFDPTVTWDDIAWLRSVWMGRILIKGVLEPDDARAAADTGADGVIVSNHGGRQLDGVASSISKLPAIVDAIGQGIEIYVDGGVRSGIDVVKAVGLGARGVLIGRPWVWAVAASGEAGLADLLGLFQREIAVAMALMGVNRLDQINSDLIER